MKAGAIVLALAACSNQISGPTAHVAQMDYVAGSAQVGLVGTPLDDKVVVRVQNIYGRPVAGATVNWSVVSGGGSITPPRSRSDANGFASASWTLGSSLGEQTATASIPGLDTRVFAAVAGEIGKTCTGSPLDLPVGASITLVGSAAVDICLASGELFTRDYVAIAFNAARAAESSVGITVLASNIVSPAGPPSQSPPTAGFSSAAAATQQLSGFSQGGFSRNQEFETGLRQLEAAELYPLASTGARTQSAPDYDTATAIPPPAFSRATPTMSEVFQLNASAQSSCKVPLLRNGRVVAISQHAIVVADVNNPIGGFTSGDYERQALTFDTLVYPVLAQNFGTPSDIDHNGRTILFYTAEVNRLTPPGAFGGTVTGFFFARDMYPKKASSRLGACPYSNEGEVLYLMAPDPTGKINNNPRDKFLVERLTLATLAHEFQHLINASRRMHVNVGAEFPEALWLDEALAHSAEELVFFRAAGVDPGQNIRASLINASPLKSNAFENFQRENVERLHIFLGETNSNWAFSGIAPGLAARGAATSFLRYSVDRLGGSGADAWRALAGGPLTGMRNLEQVIRADPATWIRDWSVALFADDVVPQTPSRYQVPSWLLRSIISNVGTQRTFPLPVTTLQNGKPSVANLKSGGSLFYRLGVPPNGPSRLHVNPSGADKSAFSVVLLRTQ